ncbi:hypothetical protein Hypma_002471 [Hypsizygus marmoreus]|uniref:Carboxymuconolactone decarboxylase-like domain-containing protein n=1 Tax=Hypsizygus marmoreus TaxID=39966 RepID=A0A369J3X7_HYPMA|nr:hypothetical protein Hypma_002471 [Hypsizygus marmoreus]
MTTRILLHLLLTIILANIIVSSFGAVLHDDTEAFRATGSKRDDNFPARVPYIFPAPGTDSIADAIRARRPNGTLLALDGVLLNAPLVASTWNSLFGVIRDNNTIPKIMIELIILRVAALNGATYEWLQHESVGRAAGFTTAQLRAIRLTPALHQSAKLTKTLGEPIAAVMAFIDWSTKSVKVPDHIFANLRQFFNNQQLVEVTATVGGYAFVSRFLVALNVDGKKDVSVPIPA